MKLALDPVVFLDDSEPDDQCWIVTALGESEEIALTLDKYGPANKAQLKAFAKATLTHAGYIVGDDIAVDSPTSKRELSVARVREAASVRDLHKLVTDYLRGRVSSKYTWREAAAIMKRRGEPEAAQALWVAEELFFRGAL